MKVKLLENTPNQLSTGPNLSRLYFDAKHLEKGLDRVW